MTKRVTRKMVAELAKVSETTVSVVVNNVQDVSVSSETRKRVMKAVRELGYYPNHAARKMAGKKSQIIAILSPWDLTQWFYAEILNGICDTASKLGYAIILSNMLKNSQKPDDCIRYFHQGMIDGVIYLEQFNLDLTGFDAIRDEGIPVVLCHGIDADKKTDEINIDYTAGIYKATQHVYNCGFTNLLYVHAQESEPMIIFDRERINGFEEFCSSVRAKSSFEVFRRNDHIEDNIKNAAQILNKYDMPAGIICSRWDLAYYFTQASEKSGNEKNVKIISADQSGSFKRVFSNITGLKLPFYRLGSLSAQTLINHLEGKAENVLRIKIEGEYDF